MAINLQNAGGRKGRRRLISEINVTPMVDVMLVLLIIFMVTSPMLVVGVEVELPETSASSMPVGTKKVEININNKGQIYLYKTQIEKDNLADKLSEIAKENKDAGVLFSCDKSVSYEIFAEVVGEVQKAGFYKIGIISLSNNK